jgi:hypothetical protein
MSDEKATGLQKWGVYIGIAGLCVLGCMPFVGMWLLQVRPIKKMAAQIRIGMNLTEVKNALGEPGFRCHPGTSKIACPPSDYTNPGYPITGELLMFSRAGRAVFVYMDTTGRVEHVGIGGS